MDNPFQLALLKFKSELELLNSLQSFIEARLNEFENSISSIVQEPIKVGDSIPFLCCNSLQIRDPETKHIISYGCTMFTTDYGLFKSLVPQVGQNYSAFTFAQTVDRFKDFIDDIIKRCESTSLKPISIQINEKKKELNNSKDKANIKTRDKINILHSNLPSFSENSKVYYLQYFELVTEMRNAIIHYNSVVKNARLRKYLHLLKHFFSIEIPINATDIKLEIKRADIEIAAIILLEYSYVLCKHLSLSAGFPFELPRQFPVEQL